MNSKIFFSVILLSCILYSYSQERIPGNKIKPEISATIEQQGESITYLYVLSNGQLAEQEIWQFELHLSPYIFIQSINSPLEWNGTYINEGGDLMIHWGTPTGGDVKPGQSIGGFSILVVSVPGIVPYYTEGWVPLPDSIGEDSEADSIYHNLTPYGPGVVGKTIGPTAPPHPFIPLVLLDTLTSYTTQSRSLEWIKDQPTADKYLSYFDSAKTSLQQDSLYAAHKILQQVLQDVDIDSTANITSEAYALLRYNTEYLIDHLQQVTAIMIAQNWNLVSVPLLQSDYSANVVFPGKFGDMFGYNTSLDNYEIAETLLCGAGYWVNYQTAGSVVISGMVPETVSVEATQEGWVLIGSRHIPVQVSSLVLSDGAVINGAAYRYNPATGAYESTPVLTPGEGHWLNVNKACTITFP